MNDKGERDKYAICTGENLSHLLHRDSVAVKSVQSGSLLLKQTAKSGQGFKYIDNDGQKQQRIYERNKGVEDNGRFGGLNIFKFKEGLPEIFHPHRAHGRTVNEGQESHHGEERRGDQIENPHEFRFGMCLGNAFFNRYGFFHILFHFFIASLTESGRSTFVLLRLEY